MQPGMLFAASAFAIWGMIPLYFKLLQSVSPSEILALRIIWSLAFLVVVLAARRHWSWLGAVLRRPAVLAGFTASALLLSANWLLYIWAVNTGRVVDASLGYFITPLINVLLGFSLLKERLRRLQWVAVGLAAAGVAWLTWQVGQLPWIALGLAFTFGAYGLLRKTAALGPLEGLTLETLLLFPLAGVYLAIVGAHDESSLFGAPLSVHLLLAASGPLTAIPLLMFAAGARRIPLSVLGFLQYIAPTLQLLLGVWLYQEPFGGARLVGFTLIWGALALLSLEGLWRNLAARSAKA